MAENNQSDISLLSLQDNIYIANFIAHESCKTFYNTYKEKWIPLSFVEFFFEEYKLYGENKSKFLKDFFDAYSPSDIVDIMARYAERVYSLVTNRSSKFEEIKYKLGNFSVGLNIDLTDPEFMGRQNSELLRDLDLVKKCVDNTDENITLKELYEKYMIRKIVLLRARTKEIRLRKDEKPKKSETSGQAKVEKAIQTTEQTAQSAPVFQNQTLVGQAIDIPEQKGHITKVLFPRLSLPSPYPVLKDKSRINSEYKIRKFTSNDMQIKIINQKKFNAVKYTTAFLEKRKLASKPQKRKFDFDF